MLLSHNFELLNPDKNRPDPIAVRRFRKLCRFLDRERASLPCSGFEDAPAEPGEPPEAPPRSRLLYAAGRMAEQLTRRLVA